MAKEQKEKAQKSLQFFNNQDTNLEPSRKVANGEISLSELEQYLWGAAKIRHIYYLMIQTQLIQYLNWVKKMFPLCLF
jgi:hypothetical protein